MVTAKHFKYFTTPIFYASGNPHGGHFYALLLTNVLKRHYVQRGYVVKVLTGLDEHGEKIEEKAKNQGLDPQNYVDSLVPQWQGAMEKLNLTYDIFLRTTSAQHKENVQAILNQCYQNGDIYFGEHVGHYCVDCEDFLTSSQIDLQGNCLIHQKPVEQRREGNYFFKFTKYKKELLKIISEGNLVSQERFKNELIAVIDALEGDLSISRPKSRTTWGIELPFDNKHVTYVWFDALPNYVTGIGGVSEARNSPFWKNCTHVLGKEILKFHGGYWPAMLMSLGLPIPKLLISGWILADGHKMSKSLGNVLSVEELAELGTDAFTNAVFRVGALGEDFELGYRFILERFNADLANGIGNLVARTFGMLEKYTASAIPKFPEFLKSDSAKQIFERAQVLPQTVATNFDDFKINDALGEIWSLISMVDKYIADAKPWTLFDPNDVEKMSSLNEVLAISVAVIKQTAFLAAAFFPEKMNETLRALGEATENPATYWERSQQFSHLAAGFRFTEVPKLYLRADIPKMMEVREQKQKNAKLEKTTAKGLDGPGQGKDADSINVKSGMIGIEQFQNVDIRIGTVVQADVVDGSNKLLKLRISLGKLGERQVFSGIKQWVRPEEVAHRKVLVVVNLTPRKMKFGISEGMVLSSEAADGRVLPVFAPEESQEGSRLS